MRITLVINRLETTHNVEPLTRHSKRTAFVELARDHPDMSEAEARERLEIELDGKTAQFGSRLIEGIANSHAADAASPAIACSAAVAPLSGLDWQRVVLTGWATAALFLTSLILASGTLTYD